MIFRYLAAIAIVAIPSSQASPWRHGGLSTATPPTPIYPGDVVGANFTTAWSMFAFTSAQAHGSGQQKVVDVTNGSSSCTIFLKGDGTPDVNLTTAGAGGIGNACVGGARSFCSGGCTLVDQSVGGHGVYDATGGTQDCSFVFGTMTVVFDQPSTGKIAIDSGVVNGESNFCDATAQFTPATGNVSLSWFGQRTGTSAGGYAVSIAEGDGGNTIEMGGGVNNWRLDIGSGDPGNVNVAAADNAWHSGNGVITSGTNNSILNIDGVETAGGPMADYPFTQTKRPFGFANNNSTVGGGTHTYGTFAGFSDNNVWSQTVRSHVCNALYTIEGQITPGVNCQ